MEKKTSSSCSRRNWRAAKMMPSPGKEPTPLKRSVLPPVTTRWRGKTPTNSSRSPWRRAKKEAAAAPRTTAAAAVTTAMMTTTMVETHRHEARSAVGVQTPMTGRCR